MMIRYLQDPQQAEFHAPLRQALRDMGRPVLNPLLAATYMKDPGTLTTIATTLADLGYDIAVPYLLRISHDEARPPPLKQAADRSRTRLGANPQASTSDAFYNLAERFYYGNAS